MAIDGLRLLTGVGEDRALDLRRNLTAQIHQLHRGGLDAAAQVQNVTMQNAILLKPESRPGGLVLSDEMAR
jgi:hypothetical protein